MSESLDNVKIEKSKLSDAERSRIERNRQKALHLKQARLVSHPYSKGDADNPEKSIIKIQGSKFIDSGGGFLIEETTLKDSTSNSASSESIVANDEAIPIPVTYHDCLECGEKFAESYLMNNFDYSVCDHCRDSEDKHSLITRTEAKKEYLLQDCDLDKREPPLKFIVRKNPHNVRWGEMKLYLHLLIEKRALEIWESEENLLKERELRDEKREKSKLKKYNKQLKQLRMNVRSSLFDRTTSASHTHSFGPETYNEDEDNYTHVCSICKYVETFEKM